MGFGISFDPTNLISAGVALYNGFQQNKWASRNYAMQRDSLNETKFMNRNQFQIQASDAQKAGINPLAMSGGSVSSASAQNVEAPQDGGMLSILGNIVSMKHEDKMQDKQIATQVSENEKKRIHEENMRKMELASEEKRHSDRLKEDARQFDSNLDELRSYHKQINDIENSKLDKHQQEIELDKLRFEIEKTSADALNSLRKQQKQLNRAELWTKANELATLSLTGAKTINANSLTGAARMLGLAITGTLKERSDLTRAIISNLEKDDE